MKKIKIIISISIFILIFFVWKDYKKINLGYVNYPLITYDIEIITNALSIAHDKETIKAGKKKIKKILDKYTIHLNRTEEERAEVIKQIKIKKEEEKKLKEERIKAQERKKELEERARIEAIELRKEQAKKAEEEKLGIFSSKNV